MVENHILKSSSRMRVTLRSVFMVSLKSNIHRKVSHLVPHRKNSSLKFQPIRIKRTGRMKLTHSWRPLPIWRPSIWKWRKSPRTVAMLTRATCFNRKEGPSLGITLRKRVFIWPIRPFRLRIRPCIWKSSLSDTKRPSETPSLATLNQSKRLQDVGKRKKKDATTWICLRSTHRLQWIKFCTVRSLSSVQISIWETRAFCNWETPLTSSLESLTRR